jgi:hypothetical protein
MDGLKGVIELFTVDILLVRATNIFAGKFAAKCGLARAGGAAPPDCFRLVNENGASIGGWQRDQRLGPLLSRSVGPGRSFQIAYRATTPPTSLRRD